MDHHPSKPSIDTAAAARACIDHIERSGWSAQAALPYIDERVSQLLRTPDLAAQLCVFDHRSHLASALHTLQLAEQAGRNLTEPSLQLHLTHRMTRSRLAAMTGQRGARGIVLNDIGHAGGTLVRHLPAWAPGDPQCLPYDPACGEEARAVLAGALAELYIEGKPGVVYMDLQAGPREGLACDRSDAYQGMYRIYDTIDQAPALRLLGAGPMLREVRAAADRLLADWGIVAQVWSCPSFTRLARDAATRSSSRASAPCHLARCLSGSDAPVIAVTGYAEYVAAQLKPHLAVSYTALGADSLRLGRLDRNWIVLAALQALVLNGTLHANALHQARRRYQLE